LRYRVLYHRNIKKDLKKLDKKVVDLFFSTVKEEILEDPYTGIKLKGRYRDLWKYRIGDFRIIYSIKKDKISVYILRIRYRSNVYGNIYF